MRVVTSPLAPYFPDNGTNDLLLNGGTTPGFTVYRTTEAFDLGAIIISEGLLPGESFNPAVSAHKIEVVGRLLSGQTITQILSLDFAANDAEYELFRLSGFQNLTSFEFTGVGGGTTNQHSS